jgi:hypothetical protein
MGDGTRTAPDRTVGDLFDLLVDSPDSARGQFGSVLALVPLEPWELPVALDGHQATMAGDHMMLKTAIGRQIPATTARPYPLPRRSSLEIGRSGEVAIRIDQPTVSRVHAELVLDGEEYQILDRNSRNGTLVNGRILEPGETVTLRDGDVVSLGEAQLLFGSLDHFANLAKSGE